MAGQSHQLAAILFADIVGYTAMMQENEELAVEKVNRFRKVVELVAEELNGKIVQYYGDGSLLLFRAPPMRRNLPNYYRKIYTMNHRYP